MLAFGIKGGAQASNKFMKSCATAPKKPGFSP